MADLSGGPFKIDNWWGRRAAGSGRRARRPYQVEKGGRERVLRQDVFDVRDEQFLMLLFVMEAKDENWLDVIEQLWSGFERRSSMCELIDAR